MFLVIFLEIYQLSIMRNQSYVKAEICIPKSKENLIKSKIPMEIFNSNKKKNFQKFCTPNHPKIGIFESISN